MHHRPIEPLEIRRLLALVIDYPMEEGSGTLVHDVASDFMPQNAELWRGARWIDTEGQTIFGRHGIELDGIDDELFISDDIGSIMGVGSASVTAWIKTTDVGAATPEASPGLLGGTFEGNGIYWGWIDDCGHINFSVPGATPEGGRDTVTSDFPINDGRWYHVGMTRDVATGEIRLYINGLLQESALADPSPRDRLFVHSIGGMHDVGTPQASRYLGASIDAVRIHDEALSASAVGIDFDPRGGPPATPTNVRVTLTGGRVIQLKWDAVVNASGYEVWRSLAGNDDYRLVALAPPGDGFLDSGLVPFTTYQYRVRAINPFGNSAFSSTTAGTTYAPNHASLFIQGTPGDDVIRVERRGSDFYVWNSADTCCREPYHVYPMIDYVEVEIHTGEGSDRIEVDAGLESFLMMPVRINTGPGGDDVRVTGRAQFLLKGSTDSDDLSAGGRAMPSFDGDQQFDSWTFEGPVYTRLYQSNVSVRTIAASPESRIDIDRGSLRLLDSPDRDAMVRRLNDMARASRSSSPPWSGPGLTSSVIDAPLKTVAVGVVTKVTYAGDVNADGKVDADDYFAIDSGFLAQTPDPLYGQGDFNYDGKVNADDYFLIDSSFLGQAQATASGASAGAFARAADARDTGGRKSTAAGESVRPAKKRHAGAAARGRRKGLDSVAPGSALKCRIRRRSSDGRQHPRQQRQPERTPALVHGQCRDELPQAGERDRRDGAVCDGPRCERGARGISRGGRDGGIDHAVPSTIEQALSRRGPESLYLHAELLRCVKYRDQGYPARHPAPLAWNTARHLHAHRPQLDPAAAERAGGCGGRDADARAGRSDHGACES
jgi:hypothetical protein